MGPVGNAGSGQGVLLAWMVKPTQPSIGAGALAVDLRLRGESPNNLLVSLDFPSVKKKGARTKTHIMPPLILPGALLKIVTIFRSITVTDNLSDNFAREIVGRSMQYVIPQVQSVLLLIVISIVVLTSLVIK